jgi:lysyl-tRNA synthetase class 2
LAEDSNLSDELRARRFKLDAMSDITPYADRFDTNREISDVGSLPDGVEGIRVAGRIVGLRVMGKLAFGHLFDQTGRVQFALQKNTLGESYETFRRYVDVGDFIGVSGVTMTTRTGEKTVDVRTWKLLSKSLRPLPEKFHGLADKEQKMRRRYLDLISSPETIERFKKRTRIIGIIRGFLDENGFLEIDTPVLASKASGAIATPFTTHYNALDIDVFLRIAPETYLKRAVAGGLNRVYEFARCFRNWNYEDNIDFTVKMLRRLMSELDEGLSITYAGKLVSFDGEWPRRSFHELIRTDSGIDLSDLSNLEELKDSIIAAGVDIEIELDEPSLGYGALVDQLYKKVSRPRLIQPTFVLHHPLSTSPLARKNQENPNVVDRFQLVINGWEIVNAYSELIDPLDQRNRFEQQREARQRGETEAMDIDEDFLLCMEHGMPPMSGWGMGIDRLVALLTDAQNLRDVVLFPLLRPLG